MPNRSLLRACGMTDEEMNQPIIGVVSAYSEIIPGHINLDKIADAVKAGVRMAGVTPVLVPAIGADDDYRTVQLTIDALLQKTDTVLFVDDEISTGKTLRNMVAQLTRRWPALGEKTLVAASLLNRVTPEQEEALADAGITCRCLVRLPQEDHTAQVADWTVTEAPPAVPQNLSFRQETLPSEGLLDPRKTLRIRAYDSSCQTVAEAMLSHTLGPVETLGKTLVLGTEECMYPALILGEGLERLGAEVCCHATTRSPIGLCDAPGYPIRSGWKLPSFYEEERTTYVYNLREYDTVIVVSDTKKTDLRAIQALASVLTCKQLIYTQGEGYVWKLSKG